MKVLLGSAVLVLGLAPGAIAQTPTLAAKLVGSTSMAGDTHGKSVALRRGMAVVGAPSPNTGAVGSAYVYQRSPGRTWTEVARLLPSDSTSNDFFGYSVATDGDCIAVGQPVDAHGGSVHLFERDLGGPNAWGEVSEIFPPGLPGNFGWSVSLQGNRLAVGAPILAYVYERDAEGTWRESGVFSEGGGFFLSNFGWSVDLDGDWLVVGDPEEDGISSGGPGAAYVFRRESFGTWSKVKKLTSPGSGGLGVSIDLDGDLLAVGAEQAVYLFDRNAGGTNQWGLVKVIQGSDRNFGLGVSVEGDRLLAGQDLVSGEHRVRLFARHLGGENAFGEVASIADPSFEPFSFFGAAVALDGARLLVGTPYEDALGPDSGAAYVFERPKIAVPPRGPLPAERQE